MGIAVQEMLEYFGIETDHISVRTSLYSGIASMEKQVRVHGLGYLVKNLNATDSLLIVDDVFDSGRSVEAVIEQLRSRTRKNTPHQIRIATPWFKPANNATSLVPDYFLYETDEWLVFPHEVQGLNDEEINSGKGGIFNILQELRKEISE